MFTAARIATMIDEHDVNPSADYYYCYCIARGDAKLSFESMETIPGGLRPEAIAIGGLQAVVSRVTSGDYPKKNLKVNLERGEWVGAALVGVLGHEQVTEECLRQTEVIPVWFNTIFRSLSDIEAALLIRQNEFHSKLQYLKGKQEWGLRLTAARSRMREQLRERDPRFRELRDGFGSKSSRIIDLRRRRLENELQRATDRYWRDAADRAFSRLAAHAERAILVPDDHPGILSGVAFLNAAFLVTKEQLARLLEEIHKMLSENSWLACEKSGPCPPLRFV